MRRLFMAAAVLAGMSAVAGHHAQAGTLDLANLPSSDYYSAIGTSTTPGVEVDGLTFAGYSLSTNGVTLTDPGSEYGGWLMGSIAGEVAIDIYSPTTQTLTYYTSFSSTATKTLVGGAVTELDAMSLDVYGIVLPMSGASNFTIESVSGPGVTDYQVAAVAPIAPTDVPEGSTFALMGIGLAVVGGAAMMRRRQVAQLGCAAAA